MAVRGRLGPAVRKQKPEFKKIKLTTDFAVSTDLLELAQGAQKMQKTLVFKLDKNTPAEYRHHRARRGIVNLSKSFSTEQTCPLTSFNSYFIF